MTGRGAGVGQGAVVDAAAIAKHRRFRSEGEFQRWVERLAALRGWVSFHDRDSRRNIAGLPDLILIRERVVWMELKSSRGKLRPEQEAFIAALRAAGQEVYVMFPSDIDKIEGVLT